MASKHWFTIDEFRDRAERVLSSRIAQREDLATIGSTMQLLLSAQQGRHQISFEYPPIEDIESAAARIRPLFLERDPVFHGKVANAISGLAQGAPDEQRAVIKVCKKAWVAHEGSSRWQMISSRVEGPPLMDRMRTDREIARDFIYGDLVHADAEARARLRHIPMEDRLLATTTWITDAIRLAEATRRLIIDLTDAGSLSPRPSD